MRISIILLLTIGTLAAGCGENEVEMGEGGGGAATPTPSGTATPTPTPAATPSPAMFAPVQTWMEDARASCGKAGCHESPGGQAGLVFFTGASTPPADVEKNRVALSCSPTLESYTPTGIMIATFCQSNGNALGAPQHGGRTNLIDADCQALFAWLQTGTGTPAACP